jgi:hypothetical protein
MLQLIEKILYQDRYLNNANKILQVGPDKSTLEICLKAINSENVGTIRKSNDKTIFYDCNQCAYRFICKKGKSIISGQLPYQSTRFHKIILLANSDLTKKSSISNIMPSLHLKGNLVMFVHNKGSEPTNKFSFSVEDIIPQINLNKLEIQSIINMQYGSNKLMCLIAVKK